MSMRKEQIVLVALTVAFPGCSKLEPKRDTPQAAIATLVKALEQGRPEVADQIVDPVLLRTDARQAACADVSLKSAQCDAALLDCFRGGKLVPFCTPKTPDGCPVRLIDCTCGSKGAAAAAGAKPFSTSAYYAQLKSFELKTERCKIQSSVPVGAGDERQEALALPDRAYCGEIAPKDELEAVTLVCGKDQFTFGVRMGSDGWRIAGFSPATDLRLSGMRAPADAVVKKREKDFNSDMK